MAFTEEQLLLIKAFRMETEDLFKALARQYYFNGGVGPYTDTAQALSVIGTNWLPFMTVNVDGTEYWYLADGSLVNKNAYLANADNSIALSKLLNITGPSFIGKQTGIGSPQVLSVETALQMLGLANVITALGQKVGKVDGYSLVANELISKIHDAGSDDQDLSAIIESINALGLAVRQLPYRIILPAASTVAGRCITPTEVPEGWTVSEGSSDQDLLITHTLDTRKVIDIKVWITTVDGERLMIVPLAYVGILNPTATTTIIESLCTKEFPIRIEILFN